MAQLVLAAAGAAVGGFLSPGIALLGMTGGQIGWMAGSMLGSMLAPKQRSAGPRLDELRVTGTEYGGGIAWVAGAPRVAGDLIWASDRREIATTEEVGKGGGGAEYTSYTYEVDTLYLLADQPGAICTRIWDNGKLIWTSLASADDESRIASEQTTKWRRITIYDGRDSQMPDPTYEAAVTNAPAYTRRLTVFIEGMQLGSSGTLPNLTFEVSSASDTSQTFDLRHAVADTGAQFADLFGDGLGFPGILALQPQVRVTVQSDVGAGVWLFDLDGTPEGTDSRTGDENYPSLPGNGGGTVPLNFPVGMLDGLPVRSANRANALGTDNHIRCGASLASAWNTGILPDLADCLPAGRYLYDTIPCSDGEHLLVTTSPVYTPGSATADRWHIIRRADLLGVLVSEGDIEDPQSLRAYGNCAQKNYSHYAAMLEDDLQHVWYAYGAGQGQVEMLKIEADGVMRQRHVMLEALQQRVFTYPSIWVEGGFCAVVSRQSYQAFRRVGDIITPVALRDVVEGLCERATMPAGSYDASALDGITRPVRALAVTNGSARQALEILQASHGFDAYCTDRLYFVPRGGDPVLTIDAADLAAGDGDAAGEPFALTVNSDLEIPARIAVSYRNMLADQVAGVEHSDRGPAGQDSIQQIQLAIGMTPDEARGTADAMVRDAYASRLTSQLALPMAYTSLTPTDVVLVPDADGTLYRMRITRRSDAGGIMSLDVVGDDAQVVAEDMATAPSDGGQAAVAPLAATTVELLDIPLLRDVDDSPGIYAAAKGAGGRWPGARLLVSKNGADYLLAANMPSPSVIGVCTTVLGDWAGGAMMDEVNAVTISVGSGQLSSVTRDALLADRTINAILIGSEVIRFASASLVSTGPNVYRLSRLLRGQLGTEWAQAVHAGAERAVLLSAAALRNVDQQAADIGQVRTYRAVTNGAPASSSAAIDFSAAGVRQRPYSPANVRIAPTGAGTYRVTWERRTRLETVIRDGRGIVVPLGEASEAYSVDAVDALGNVLQTIESASPEVYIGAPAVGLAYAVGLKWPHEWSGAMYGVQLTYGTPTQLVRTAADGSVSAQTSTFPGIVTDVVYTGAGVAYVMTVETSVSGLSFTANKLRRVDLATMAVTATVDLFALSGGTAIVYDIALDGADLWSVANVDGKLQKHDPTTLAITSTITLGNTPPSGSAAFLALASDGAGVLFVANRDSTKILAYQTTGTPGTVWEVAIPTSVGAVGTIFCAGSALFVSGGQGAAALHAPTGSLLFDYGEACRAQVRADQAFSLYAGAVIYASQQAIAGTGSVSYVIGPVRVLDPSTGALLQSFTLPGAFDAVAGTGSSLVAAVGDFTSRRYDPIGDLSGGEVRVYQLSAAVGRGYPATIDIP